MEGKVESLESIVRMFELKAKNAQDHSKLYFSFLLNAKDMTYQVIM